MATTNRPLYEIAREIRKDWRKEVSGTSLYFGAAVYLSAMSTLNDINDQYIMESGREIVNRFLGQAGTWKGETARRIKKELNAMVKSR